MLQIGEPPRIAIMRRLTGITLSVLVAATVTGGALVLGTSGAVADPGEIPDTMLLSSADLGGAAIEAGGPDPALRPLPLRPCADTVPTTPTAERTINASLGRYHVYEHVARYPDGQAQAVLEDLRADLARCAQGAGQEHYQVLAQYTTGILLLREFNDADDLGAYSVGVAGDHLVTVLESSGDVTTASSFGTTAITRAGGVPGVPLPSVTPSTPAGWTTVQATVTAVHRGPDPTTLLVDVDLPAGAPACARNPQITYLEVGDQIIWANVVHEQQAGADCPDRATAVVTLTSPSPIGDRIVVLNQQAWAPDGDSYRRCDPTLGCDPPADHCASAWMDQATGGLDIPRHSARRVEFCDGAWLVITIDVNAAVCGAEPRPGCSAPADITRYFLRFDTRWQVLATTRAAGCAAVLAVEPTFPIAVCERLPATG